MTPVTGEGGLRAFVLRRDADVSGVSGTGDVAEGVVFSDGTTVLRWNRAGGSTAVYDSLERMEAIHGHDGRTAVVFAAPAPDTLREALEQIDEIAADFDRTGGAEWALAEIRKVVLRGLDTEAGEQR